MLVIEAVDVLDAYEQVILWKRQTDKPPTTYVSCSINKFMRQQPSYMRVCVCMSDP